MKHYKLTLIITIAFLSTLWFLLTVNNAEATNDWYNATNKIIQAIQLVDIDYTKKYWQSSCQIDGKQVSLWQMLYSRSVREWADNPNFITHIKNNPWAIKAPQWVKTPTHYEAHDNDNDRPVYATMYDWYYELAHLLVQKYDCNFSSTSLTRYINGSWPATTYILSQLQDMKNVKSERYNRLIGKTTLTQVATVPVEVKRERYDEAQAKQNKLNKLVVEAKEAWRLCKINDECIE